LTFLVQVGQYAFDYAPTQVGIHLTTLGPQNGFAKRFIGDLLSTRKTNKPSGFQDSHEMSLKVSHMVLLFK